eukprot:gene6113-4395_t
MIGRVELIDSDGERVNHVRIRVPSRRAAPGDEVLAVQTKECIGKGSFGTVYRAEAAGFPGSIALKVTTGKLSRLQQELEVLSKVCTKGHLSLPRFEFGALHSGGELLVIGMELCVPSTLHDLLLSTRITNEGDMLFMGYQAAQAVACVHAEGCVHRDVKMQNFVFDLSGNLKLIDFGLAAPTPNPPAGDIVAGTVSFMAPEMARNALDKQKRVSVGASADIWSLGIVLYSIFTQRNPYTTGDRPDAVTSNADLLNRVAAGAWRWPDGCHVSAPIRELITTMLTKNPAERPTIEGVLQHKIWNVRRRSPPTAITAFLGVQEAADLFNSNDESCLMRAIHHAAGHGTRGEAGEAGSVELVGDDLLAGRTSLKVVTKEKVELDGSVHVTDIYDVRGGPRRNSRPVREISEVIRDKSLSSRRQRAMPSTNLRTGSTARQNAALMTPHSADGPAPSPCKPPSTIPVVHADALVQEESYRRAALTGAALLEHCWYLESLRLLVEEDQERCTIEWLAGEQAKSAGHPHAFAAVRQAAKGAYRYGFVCDMCDYAFEPEARAKYFLVHHCKCGRDLCTTCFEAYRKRCTCERCGQMLPNEHALMAHQQHGSGTCPGRDAAAPGAATGKRRAAAPKRLSVATVGRLRGADSATAAPSNRLSVARITRNRKSRTPETVSATLDDDDDNESSGLRVESSSASAVPRRRRTAAAASAGSSSGHSSEQGGAAKLRRVESAPTDQKWEPFATLRKELDAVPQAVLPTEEERQVVLQGPWIQYFFFYPPQTDENPQCFAYHIQPGRTGAMFLNSSFSWVHSAVFSQLERVFFCVESVDLSAEVDAVSSYSLVQAKANPRLQPAFDALQEIATYDTNIRKQHRFPGTSSVYPSPRSVYNSKNAPLVFVRWFRISKAMGLHVMVLSNGATQVLVENKFELRWFDMDRIFLIRSNGVCEVFSMSCTTKTWNNNNNNNNNNNKKKTTETTLHRLENAISIDRCITPRRILELPPKKRIKKLYFSCRSLVYLSCRGTAGQSSCMSDPPDVTFCIPSPPLLLTLLLLSLTRPLSLFPLIRSFHPAAEVGLLVVPRCTFIALHMPVPVDQTFRERTLASRYRPRQTLPPNFSDVLKEYAREVLRAQPEDILEWSADYFLQLAINGAPLPHEGEEDKSVPSEVDEDVEAVVKRMIDVFQHMDAANEGLLFIHLVQRALTDAFHLSPEQALYILTSKYTVVNPDETIEYRTFARKCIRAVQYFQKTHHVFKLGDLTTVTVHGMNRNDVEYQFLHIFRLMDQPGTGRIPYADFRDTLANSPFNLTHRDVRTLCIECEISSDNHEVEYEKEVPLMFPRLVLAGQFELFDLEDNHEDDEAANANWRAA